jgi:hypothetical protein
VDDADPLPAGWMMTCAAVMVVPLVVPRTRTFSPAGEQSPNGQQGAAHASNVRASGTRAPDVAREETVQPSQPDVRG